MTAKARFLSHVRKTRACWVWTGATVPGGYGRFRGEDGSLVVAHRFAFAIFVSDPGEQLVLHRCDNPPCVRPDHLFLGTHGDNMRDMRAKGRHVARRPDPKSAMSAVRRFVVEHPGLSRSEILQSVTIAPKSRVAGALGVLVQRREVVTVGHRGAFRYLAA